MFTWQATSQGVAILKDGKIVLIQTFDPEGNPNLPIPADKKAAVAAKLIEGMQPREIPANDGDKRIKLLQINAAYNAAIAALTAGYPESEIDTWGVQRDEAYAWNKDANSPTPWIDIAAAARGVPREIYLQRTLAKAQAFSQTSARLTGLRQKYEDQVKQALTLKQLEDIQIVYS